MTAATRIAFTHAKRRIIYSLLTAVICSIAMGVVSIQYANYAVHKNQQQWCEVVTILDDAYRSNPPQTPAGQHLAREFARMRKDFHCKAAAP